MRRIIILLLTICILTFSLVGCNSSTNNKEKEPKDEYFNEYFVVIEKWQGEGRNVCQIVYAKDTKVMYFICYNNMYKQGAYGIAPLYNADGTLQVYSE